MSVVAQAGVLSLVPAGCSAATASTGSLAAQHSAHGRSYASPVCATFDVYPPPVNAPDAMTYAPAAAHGTAPQLAYPAGIAVRLVISRVVTGQPGPDLGGGGVGPRAPGPPPTGGLPPIQFKLINCKK